MNYFVTGIDTDSGKTLVSAILCETLSADYWKPIQAGTPRDTDTVASLISRENFIAYREAYLLNTPASPHAAAKIDGVTISIQEFKLPQSDNTIIIEGAGGCLVPINEDDFVIDLITLFKAEVIVVADLYLGSINHTLLTIDALRNRKLNIKGIIFNGESNPESERIILHHSKLKCLLRIKREKTIDQSIVRKYASELNNNWNE